METVVRVPVLRSVYTNTSVRRKVDGIFFAVRDCLVELSSFPDRENLLTRRMNVLVGIADRTRLHASMETFRDDRGGIEGWC